MIYTTDILQLYLINILYSSWSASMMCSTKQDCEWSEGLALAWNCKGINPLKLTKPTSSRLWPLLYIDYMIYIQIYRQFICAQQEEIDYILYSPFECGMSASCKLMHALCMTQLKSSLGIYRDVHFSSLPIVIGYYSDYYCSSGNVYNGSIDSPAAVH